MKDLFPTPALAGEKRDLLTHSAEYFVFTAQELQRGPKFLVLFLELAQADLVFYRVTTSPNNQPKKENNGEAGIQPGEQPPLSFFAGPWKKIDREGRLPKPAQRSSDRRKKKGMGHPLISP